MRGFPENWLKASKLRSRTWHRRESAGPWCRTGSMAIAAAGYSARIDCRKIPSVNSSAPNDPIPGFQNPDSISPLGPSDPELPIIAVSIHFRPAHCRAGELCEPFLTVSLRPRREYPWSSPDFTGAFADKFALLIGAGVDQGVMDALRFPLATRAKMIAGAKQSAAFLRFCPV